MNIVQVCANKYFKQMRDQGKEEKMAGIWSSVHLCYVL